MNELGKRIGDKIVIFDKRQYILPEFKLFDYNSQIHQIIKNQMVSTVFQPIISLSDGSVLGYEALSRGPKGTSMEKPEKLFEAAREEGKLWDLEEVCRVRAFRNALINGIDGLLFINTDPQVIQNDKFRKIFTKDYLKKHHMNPDRIVFEITEKFGITNIKSFQKVINHFKKEGYMIAIDDVGSGYSGLNLITDIRPRYIKLDINLIRNMDKDIYKYTLIKSLCEFCTMTGNKIIAEGIETEDEFNALIDIGIHYGQGYYIQRGTERIKPIRSEIIEAIKTRNTLKSKSAGRGELFIGSISHDSITVSSDSSGQAVIDLLNAHEDLPVLPVISGQKVCGVISRNTVTKFALKNGYGSLADQAAFCLMDRQPLSVDYKTSIGLVLELAMKRCADHFYDDIIVTKNEAFHGVVSIRDLFARTQYVL